MTSWVWISSQFEDRNWKKGTINDIQFWAEIEFRAKYEIDIRFQYDSIWSEYRAEFEFRAKYEIDIRFQYDSIWSEYRAEFEFWASSKIEIGKRLQVMTLNLELDS